MKDVYLWTKLKVPRTEKKINYIRIMNLETDRESLTKTKQKE